MPSNIPSVTATKRVVRRRVLAGSYGVVIVRIDAVGIVYREPRRRREYTVPHAKAFQLAVGLTVYDEGVVLARKRKRGRKLPRS